MSDVDPEELARIDADLVRLLDQSKKRGDNEVAIALDLAQIDILLEQRYALTHEPDS